MSVRYDLMPHQKTGADFLANREFAFLLDEPGAGKTGQAIAAADRCHAKRILVISPAVVRNHWAISFENQQEIERPINVVELPTSYIPKSDCTVTIISHAALVSKRRLAELDAADPYDVIILDESAEFRRFQAARTRNLYGERGLWTKCKHFWALTGTPIIGSAADLYPLVYGPLRRIYSPVPDWWDFCSVYTELRMDERGDWKAYGIKEAERLADLFRPYTIRRTLESAGIQLPSLTVVNKSVVLPPAALIDVMAGLEGWTPERLTTALSEQDELKDSALARVRRALGLAKASAVVDHIRSIGQPVVAFFQHTDVRNALGQPLTDAGLRVAYIDGHVSRSQLTGAQTWFREGALDVLLVQTQAGGLGLTLTTSNRAIIAELPWTDAALSQAIARVHRYTQTRPVTAEIMQAEDVWLDAVLASVVRQKHVAAQSFLSLLTTGVHL